MANKVGKPKQLVGDCWTITFETVSQRAIGNPDNVFTWGGVTGTWGALVAAIDNMGGTIEQIITYNSEGLEISDVRDVEICVPCESFDVPPSNTLAWSFLNGTRTAVWSKKFCPDPDQQQFCFETCTVEAFLDNQTSGEPPWGAMMWPFRNWRVEIKMSDGSTCVVDHPKTINQGDPLDWRNNIEVFAASLAAKTGKPWQRKSAPLDGDPATPVANHSGATCCCSDPLPVSALGYRVNDDGTDVIDPKTGQPFPPTPFLTGVWKKEITRVWLCRDCDGNEEWRADSVDGEPGEIIEKPELCLYPCGQVPDLPELEDTGCEVEIISACEIQPGEPATVATSGIFLNYNICGTTVSLDSAVTFPNGPSENPVEHVLVDGNFYGDCNTLEPIEPPLVDPCDNAEHVKICPVKELVPETFRVCWFADGDLNNCDANNVTQTFATKTTCIVDGEVAGIETTYTEIDGATPFDPETLGESAVAVPCIVDADNNVLIGHETCYKYTVPKVVRPVKAFKSLRSLSSSIKLSKTVRSKTERIEVAEEQPEAKVATGESDRVELAISNQDAPASLEFNPDDCLRVTEYCICGSTEIVQTTYELVENGLAIKELDGPIEVGGKTLWQEVPCDPRIEIVDEDLGDCEWCCEFSVPRDRNGYQNTFQSTNFTIGSYTGANWPEVKEAMEADGVNIVGDDAGDIECLDAECHSVKISLYGPVAIESWTYENAQSGTITLTGECRQVPCGWELTQELIDLQTPCCDSRIVTDAICFDVEVTLGDSVVPAGQPVVRQLTFARTYNTKTCACEDLPGEGDLRYYNFLDPTQELTLEVETAVTGGAEFSTCTPIENITQELCDSKGNRYVVVTLTVGANGGVATTTIYNQDGQPVPTPEDLQPCPGNLNAQCGCIRNPDGSIAIRNVREWNGVNESGGKIHGGYTVGPALTNVTIEIGQYFDCDCSDKCADKTQTKKYTYSGITFPCESPTISVDGEVTELCDPDSTGPASIPSIGDLHTVGGVRSTNTGGRCDPAGTTDPSGLAAELQNFGSVGDETVNPLATLTNTANAHIAVRNTFPVTGSATSIDFTATWNVGSGIGVMAYDCSDGVELTPSSNLSSFAECRPSTRGPVDAWGAGNNGQTLTTTWTKPGNASFDLEDIVFVTIVNNPPGDHLSAIMVNGESPGASGCTATTFEDLATLISNETGLDAVVVDGAICITTDGVLGPITCGETSYDPTVLDLGIDILPSFVALAPKSINALACAMAEKLAEILMVDKPEDAEEEEEEDEEGSTTTPTLPASNRKVVSDNFQDGGGNAPFNLQVRNATSDAVNWQALVSNVPYQNIPAIVANGTYTLVTSSNADGTFNHLFTGTAPLAGFANITITGGVPTPSGNGSGLSLFCEVA